MDTCLSLWVHLITMVGVDAHQHGLLLTLSLLQLVLLLVYRKSLDSLVRWYLTAVWPWIICWQNEEEYVQLSTLLVAHMFKHSYPGEIDV